MNFVVSVCLVIVIDVVVVHYFSFVTPLKGFLFDFVSMNWPVSVLRLTNLSLCGFLTWVRFRTAPRRPGPLGGLVAISSLSIGLRFC